MSSPFRNVAGVILAGGQARRLGGGDKPLKLLGGQTMLSRVIERLRPQVGPIVLNANGDPARFADFGLPVAPDPIEGFAGPLAGILAGLCWAGRNAPGCRWIATIAGDTPFFPNALIERLIGEAGDGKTIALAASNGRVHPVFGLWPVALAKDLRMFLIEEENRKVLAWVDRHPRVDVGFEIGDNGDPFFNVNTPEDLARAEAVVQEVSA